MTDGKRPAGRPPERLKVVVNFKVALATPPEIEEVLWPKGWGLPVAGDEIRVGNHHGFVTHLTYDLTRGIIKVNTR